MGGNLSGNREDFVNAAVSPSSAVVRRRANGGKSRWSDHRDLPVGTNDPAGDGSARQDNEKALTMHKIVHPEGWKPAKGYANAVVAEGELVFLGGQIGWTADQVFETDDFVEQVEQALRNIVAILACAGGRPEHLVRLTWFVVDKRDYLERSRELGEAYRRVLGRHFPAMSVMEVSAMVEDRAKVEIEATAVISRTGR